jgi:hypothetical protein
VITCLIKTISDTIIWVARERMKDRHYQNLASAIYAVEMEVRSLLIDAMKEGREEKEND